jgi:hypothetical protein
VPEAVRATALPRAGCRPAACLLAIVALVFSVPAQPPVDFDTEIIPVLTKAGCNRGACHGAAAGRGGLRLSLYGGDPEFDYRSLVLELEGRRVNLARPADSLVLRKPTELMAHGGGLRLQENGPGARLLRDWIRQGALRRRQKELQHFSVSPPSQVMDRPEEPLSLRATARFRDGSTADVTRWTVFTAEDPAAVAIDPDTGTARPIRRGRHIVIARYLDRVVPVEIILPVSEQPVDVSREPRRNFIDDHVLQLLGTLRIPVSPPADDAAFIRRVTLDLTGRLPDVEAVQKFLAGRDPRKREALIDRLLNSSAGNEYWTWKLARLFRIRSQPGDRQGALTYHRWLHAQLVNRVPYDAIARQMLLATGDTHEVGPANFHRTAAGPREQAELTSEIFLGSRLRCANCHNHPLDRWTQDDYHGLAAIFAPLQRGRVIQVGALGQVTHPRSGRPATPRIPGERFLSPDDDARRTLAEWLTDAGNPFFAKAIVNRLWRALLGRGLVEPTDDMRDTNPATHPRLLEELAADFVKHGYDLRHTLRRIARSAAYQRSARTVDGNSRDQRYYSHALKRPLPAEVLADAVADVSGVPGTYGEQPAGTRAVALFDPQTVSDELDVLGRCPRIDSCESEQAGAGGLKRTLHLLNGPLLNDRIAAAEGYLQRSIATGDPPLRIVEHLYWRALSRPPTKDERDFWNRQLTSAADPQHRQDVLEDFLWGLLCCREFVTNH